MLPDRVLNPGPLTYESGALPIALRGPAIKNESNNLTNNLNLKCYIFCGSEIFFYLKRKLLEKYESVNVNLNNLM